MRKLFQQTIGPREIHKWHSLIERCTTEMLIKTKKDPAGLAQHAREYVLAGSKHADKMVDKEHPLAMLVPSYS